MALPVLFTCLLAFTFCMGNFGRHVEFKPRYTIASFRKMAVDSAGENVYIGDKNYVYHLNGELKEIEGPVKTGPKMDSKTCKLTDSPDQSDVDRCRIKMYDDYSQVVQVHENASMLITCGTVDLGKCVGRDLKNISSLITDKEGYILLVGIDEDSSTESVIADVRSQPVLFIGKSYVETTGDFEKLSENNVRDLLYGGLLETDDFLGPYTVPVNGQNKEIFRITTKNEVGKKDFDFVVKFMSYFSESVYTLFWMKKLAEPTLNPVSKIAKMCTLSTNFKSYEDMPITCSTFPYIQDGVVLNYEGQEVLIGLFSSTETVDRTSECAVCAYTKADILEGFRMSRLEPPCLGQEIRYPTRYIDGSDELKGCLNCSNDPAICGFLNKTNFCSDRQSNQYIMGVKALAAVPVFRGQGLRSLGGMDRNDLMTIFVGTEMGDLHKLYLRSPTSAQAEEVKSAITVFARKIPANPIIDIVTTQKNRIYILNRFNVILLDDPDCSTAKNCLECMNIADNKCGWCILNSRCVEKNACSNGSFWLPSIAQKCLSVSTDPPGIHSQDTDNKNFVVVLSPRLPLNAGDWQCSYGDNKGKQYMASLEVSEGIMTCEISNIQEFIGEGYADFNISSKTSARTLSSGWQIQFYNCADFRKCSDCVANPNVTDCHWSPGTTECTQTNKNGAAISAGKRANFDHYVMIKLSFGDSVVSVPQMSRCPQLTTGQIILIPNNRTINIRIPAKNLPVSGDANQLIAQYSCLVDGQSFTVGSVNETSIWCADVNVSYSGDLATVTKTIQVKYKGTYIDNPGNVSNATVYKCEHKADSCSTCLYIREKGYLCGWRTSTCSFASSTDNVTVCTRPEIFKIFPHNGTVGGNTTLTISGKNFGIDFENIQDIFVAGNPCRPIKDETVFYPQQSIQCITAAHFEINGGRVIVKVDGKNSSNDITFDYVKPSNITSIFPDKGIKSGGRRVTIKGRNMIAGDLARMDVKLMDMDRNKQLNCQIDVSANQPNKNEIVCLMGAYEDMMDDSIAFTMVQVSYDMGSFLLYGNVQFTVVADPIVDLKYTRAIQAGGVNLTITGKRFSAVSSIRLEQDLCHVVDDEEFTCIVPPVAPDRRRRRRSTSPGSVDTYTLYLDNYSAFFQIERVNNPNLHSFEDTRNYKPGTDQRVVIQGDNLLEVASLSDYHVLVQLSPSDDVTITANGSRLSFKPPAHLSEGNDYLVVVLVGRYSRQHVGYLYYEKDVISYIIIGVLSGVVVCMLVVILLCFVCVRRKNRKLHRMKSDIIEMECNIKEESRLVFAEFNINMKGIRGDLVTTGIPYFDYHNYSFHALFPKLRMDECIYYEADPLHQAEENGSKTAPSRGMSFLEELLQNKFFLQSLIKTLERQNRFNVQEKAEFSSLLTLILLGKMSYLSEVIEVLLGRLIGDATKKQHRVLFRRSDTITQKLLSDWMSLALYPYLKGGGGQQLFMLYKATQTVMEKGPIDAITLDAKDTLAEERLLKRDVAYETLTLEVDLNGNTNHKYTCTVLDCDTISQVKAKCMYEIYKNKPASELQLTTEELILEWHAGQSGKLVLNDIDQTSSKKEGYVCHNTLRHYNVKDGTCMALLIADEGEDDQNHYENFSFSPTSEPTSLKDVLLSEHSVTSNLSMVAEKQWHVVFPEQDEKAGKRHAHTEDLYLNRLLHTKLKLMEYINAVFDNVLDEKKTPPLVRYLFRLLEDLASEHGVDPDIVPCWKSECYAIRLWSMWISRPDLLFDVLLPKHVVPCLDIMKCVFTDVFSQASVKLTKDSSSDKLLFANEVPECQEKVCKYYERLGKHEDPVTKSEFSALMHAISEKQTSDVRVKKLPALRKLFEMIRRYSDEIIADLDEERETKDLELGTKFDSVMRQMDLEKYQ